MDFYGFSSNSILILSVSIHRLGGRGVTTSLPDNIPVRKFLNHLLAHFIAPFETYFCPFIFF